MRQLKTREIAAIKRQFKNSLPLLNQIDSINKKIVALGEEKATKEAMLNGGEAGIIALTGGYRSVDLIKCEYVPQFNEDGTPKMDANGKYQVKKQVLTFVLPAELEAEVDSKAVDADNEIPMVESQENTMENLY